MMQSLKSPPSSPMRSRDRRPPRPNTTSTTKKLYFAALGEAFWKFNPIAVLKNPVMFLVWVSMLIMLVISIQPSLFGHIPGNHPRLYNAIIAFILFATIWFANFAEAIASMGGKAKAKKLRAMTTNIIAKKLKSDGSISEVAGESLRYGDMVYAIAGDIIPTDGEVTMGAASVDESAITGESAPILKETGSDVACSVIGGTRVIADELIIRVTANPGDGFVDRMITLLAAKDRTKTPNEIAITILLGAFSLIFLFVAITLPAFASYLKIPITVPVVIAFFVSLLPTTIGAFIPTIGIAGVNRVAQANVIATSRRAVETCGDINTLILDKTGTITLGNRLAEEFIPINGHSLQELAQAALIASLFDETTEGKSIVRLAEKLGAAIDFDPRYAEAVAFSPTARMSGTNLANGIQVRKGSVTAIQEFARFYHGNPAADLELAYQRVSEQGGTPLAVALDNDVYGVIYLRDIIKPGIRDRFEQLRRIGVRTVMVTGDNQITASVIAQEAGVDEFIADATPEEKIDIINREQAAGNIVAMTGDGNNDAPALAQAHLGLAMNTGTQAAKQAANMIDLDSDPTKLIDLVEIGKQFLITRSALMLFSLTNDIGKYFAIIPVVFATANLQGLNFLRLESINSAIFAALIYNALIIPILTPLVLFGLNFQLGNPHQLSQRYLAIFGLGGIITPFVAIKILDLILTTLGVV